MPPIPYVSNQALTAAAVNDAVDGLRLVRYQTSDISVSNSFAIGISKDLTFPMKPLTRYALRLCLFYRTSTTADIQFSQVTFPPISAVASEWRLDSTVTSAVAPISMDSSGGGATLNNGGAGTSATVCARPVYHIYIYDNFYSQWSVQFYQPNPEATNTTLMQGSWGALTQVTIP